MSSHPDADALIRAILDRPTDETPRLVLADWLDDTGGPAEAAWAGYIRARAAGATNAPTDGIVARLSAPARRFISAPGRFLDLLPADRITLHFRGCIIPPEVLEFVPQSVAETSLVLPLGEIGRTCYLAVADPTDPAMLQRLEFILNRDIVAFRADPAEIRRVLHEQYPPPVDIVEEQLFEFPEYFLDFPREPGDESIPRLANLILVESVRFGAGWIEITPAADVAQVRFRLDDDWFDRDRIPIRYYPALAARLAEMAGIPAGGDGAFAGDGEIRLAHDGIEATFAVLIDPLPAGPWVWIERQPDPAART